MRHPVAPIEPGGMTRAAFVVRGAVAAAAAYGVAAVTPFVTSALAQRGDLATLDFALMLEHLETELYEQAAALELSQEVAALARTIGEQEAEHAQALTATIRQLGGTPAQRPRFTFPMTDEASFLAVAQSVEDTGLHAYNGAVLALDSGELLATTASIAQVEARHAAALRLARGLAPAPRGFDKALGEAQARKVIAPLLRS